MLPWLRWRLVCQKLALTDFDGAALDELTGVHNGVLTHARQRLDCGSWKQGAGKTNETIFADDDWRVRDRVRGERHGGASEVRDGTHVSLTADGQQVNLLHEPAATADVSDRRPIVNLLPTQHVQVNSVPKRAEEELRNGVAVHQRKNLVREQPAEVECTSDTVRARPELSKHSPLDHDAADEQRDAHEQIDHEQHAGIPNQRHVRRTQHFDDPSLRRSVVVPHICVLKVQKDEEYEEEKSEI
mmetsp:Transcript_515/g.1790  ORF Transcript_515/g.1790 Transcript_515/m.1790 type:complete len:243 (-) Transcript_515:5932-6660(-)